MSVLPADPRAGGGQGRAKFLPGPPHTRALISQIRHRQAARRRHHLLRVGQPRPAGPPGSWCSCRPQAAAFSARTPTPKLCWDVVNPHLQSVVDSLRQARPLDKWLGRYLRWPLARVQANTKGARRRPIVSGATRSGILLACWGKRFYLLFTCLLWGSLPRRKTAAGGCSSRAERAGVAVASMAAAPYPVFHQADSVYRAKHAAEPVH
jgi:hypothetical protein